jgi:poly(hydroxyalkanoate) depolymerase family esterase
MSASLARSTLLLLLLTCFSLAQTASAGQFEQKSFMKKSYQGSRDRQYQVFVPSAYTGQSPVPMVMVLHGCSQNETNMINETRFKDLAERDNFIVVYPFITSYEQLPLRGQNCWGFFIDQHIHKGAGEVEDLYQIALEVEAAFKIDPNRRYVTGLSSGAGMAVDLAVARNEYFAAAGSVEGLPYSETSSSVVFFGCNLQGHFKPVSADVAAIQAEETRPGEQRAIPIIAVHDRNDCIVNLTGAENIRDSWLARFGINQAAVAIMDCTARGVSCTQTKYGSPQRSVVETVFYDGDRTFNSGHYWVGDNSGQFANPNGPSASELQWTFFQGHPLADSPPPTVAITSASANGTSVILSGSAAASAGSLVEVDARLDGQFPQPQKVASGTTAWTITFDNLRDNANYLPTASAKDSNGLTASVAGQPVAVGVPPTNAPPSVGIDNVSVTGDCIALTGTASDTDDHVSKVEIQLATRGFKPAALSETNYRYQECGLPVGIYVTQAQATDSLGAKSAIASGPTANVSDLEVVTADWQVHMSAGRLRVYGGRCPSPGFGACDLGFAEIFLANQFNPFPLQRKAASPDWYVHRENIP